MYNLSGVTYIIFCLPQSRAGGDPADGGEDTSVVRGSAIGEDGVEGATGDGTVSSSAHVGDRGRYPVGENGREAQW